MQFIFMGEKNLEKKGKSSLLRFLRQIGLGYIVGFQKKELLFFKGRFLREMVFEQDFDE